MAKMDDPDSIFSGNNAACGDWLEISLKFKGRKITRGRFLHKGCAVSAVAASVLLAHAEGKTMKDIEALAPEDQLRLFGAPVSPARLKCALLPLEVVRSGLEKEKLKKEERRIKK